MIRLRTVHFFPGLKAGDKGHEATNGKALVVARFSETGNARQLEIPHYPTRTEFTRLFLQIAFDTHLQMPVSFFSFDLLSLSHHFLFRSRRSN